MTDQRLVDELEKALNDEVYDGGMGALSEEQLSELVRTLASTAAKVAEEAHTPTDAPTQVVPVLEVEGDAPSRATPTDDEREALIDALLDELGWEWDEVPEERIPSSRAILGDMADRVFAVTARFRRSVVPEPSAWPCCRHCMRGDGTRVADCTGDEDSHMSACRHGCNEKTIPKGEPSEVEFPFTHDGVKIEQDDGGLWITVNPHEPPRWLGPKALAALRAAGVGGAR